MNYAVVSRASKETETALAQDITVMDLITQYETPMPDENEIEIDADVKCKLHLKPEVVGTETIEEEGESYEVEVTNRADIIDAIALGVTEWQEAKIHNCSHDEQINRPCSPWQLCQTHGDVPEEVEE